ncbi:MAG: FkbM family methyltransferase [Limnohabitans sp.]|nr:FkbM family methyltransferase [Limnohabitans sp.]
MFDQTWEGLFVNDKKFVNYELEKGLSINLYKDSLLAKLIYRGDFELEELDYMNQVLKDGDTFVDVGANIGLFSLFASRRVGALGKVILFEPSPKTYRRTVENIEINKCSNVVLNQLGISDKPDQLSLNISGDGYDAWETFAPDTSKRFQHQVTVPVTTLDIILDKEDKSKIKLIKIDVEGWEKFVLLGGTQFFTQFKPIVMLEFTEDNTKMAGYAVTELYDIMVAWGYEWYAFEKGKLVSSARKESYPYENLIAIKK